MQCFFFNIKGPWIFSVFSRLPCILQCSLLPRAFVEAQAVPGCLVHLGDRPINITLKVAEGRVGGVAQCQDIT